MNWMGVVGIPNTIHKSPQVAALIYKMIMDRESMLKLIGIKVVSMWEDEWKYEMNNFTDEYRDEVIQHVNASFINPREALHGESTEVFKTFYEIKVPGEIIFGFDISSQYPAVTVLDSYAVEAKKSKKTHCKTSDHRFTT